MNLKNFLTEKIIPKNKKIAIDFDGVIHSYEKGWDDGSIYGTPKQGSVQTIKKLKEDGFYIIINTSRVITWDNKIDNEMKILLVNWLKKYDIPFDEIFPKVIAIAYIDDRAVNFDVNKDPNDEWKNVYLNIKKLNKL